MAKAPKPARAAPSSIRIGEERTLRFEAYRDREKLSFSDAIHKLLDAALAQEGFPPPGYEVAPKAKTVTLPADFDHLVSVEHRSAGGTGGGVPKARTPKAAPKSNGRAPHVDATFGPAPVAPGSRLKKPKAAKDRWGL